MPVTINGTTGIAGVDGSASTPAVQGTDTNTGIFFGTDTVTVATGGTTAVTVDSGQRTKFPTTIGVGNATPAASGAGITFPATASASSDANTLDDYEEGTFTPDVNIDGATTGITYTGRAGKYTKIGNLVYVSLGVTLSSKGALSGNITIAGLPFASANTDYREPYWRGTSNNFADFSAAVTTSATTLQVRNPTTTAAITNTTLANNSSLFVNGCYQI